MLLQLISAVAAGLVVRPINPANDRSITSSRRRDLLLVIYRYTELELWRDPSSLLPIPLEGCQPDVWLILSLYSPTASESTRFRNDKSKTDLQVVLVSEPFQNYVSLKCNTTRDSEMKLCFLSVFWCAFLRSGPRKIRRKLKNTRQFFFSLSCPQLSI